MKFLFYFLVCIILAVVFYTVISFLHFAFVRIKAYIIRRKLSMHSATEIKKDD